MECQAYKFISVRTFKIGIIIEEYGATINTVESTFYGTSFAVPINFVYIDCEYDKTLLLLAVARADL